MAAEVPVKDVLCEAMEYLSKLGSNLRTRTENLREKKIKKDKLNNALALQKTASKVLLICELSKKSLENVETGVRKILERVDTSQAALSDVGGNSSSTDIRKKSNSENPHYYSFVYKSRKLRIKKKVNVRHYMSVKVFAKKMPTSMLEKYPVYHDCKLFRIRKKRDQRVRLDSASDDEDKSNNEQQRQASVSEDRIQVKSENKEKRNTDKSEQQSSKIHSRDRTKSRSTSKQIDDSPTKIRDKSRKDESLNKSKEHRSSMDSVDAKKNKHKESEGLDDSDKNQKSSTSWKKEIKKKRIVIESSEDEEITYENKSKPVSQDDNSCSVDKEKSSRKEDKNIEHNESDDIDVNDHNADITVEQPRQLDDLNDSVQEPELKKRKLNLSDEKLQNDENNDVVTLDSSDENRDSPVKNNEPENSENDQKPVIKLVSLSKLLKPDVLQKSELVDNKTKDKDSKKTKVGERSFQMMKKRMEKEEEYWKGKRKEVKAFKPKKFTINIVRLPKLSKHFLQDQQLKRVIQNGKTIFKIDDENHQSDKNEKEQPVSSDDELVTKTNKVKNSLLSESESDSQINEEATKVKDALLKDSDSDSFGIKDSGSTNENENTALENKRTKATKVKDALLKDSDSDSIGNKDAGSTNEDKNTALENKRPKATKVKDALLNDSDNDSICNKNAGSTNGDENAALKGKRTKSTKVKDTLLKDSDSDSISNKDAGSTNEDENTALKSKRAKTTKVKDALLKDSDSDSIGNKDAGSTNDDENTALKSKRAKATKVKDELLKDSDSDSIGYKDAGSTNEDENTALKSKGAKATEIKDALLKDSDSDSIGNKDAGSSNEDENTALENKRANANKVKDALLKDSDSDSIGNRDSGSTKQNENTAYEDKKAKDSNSDSNRKKTNNENEQVKLRVIGSDSENRENESENSYKNNETNVNDVESKTNDNESDREKDQNDKLSSEKHENQSPLNQSEDKDAKDSLLNNSSDDRTSTPLKQRRESKSVTPQSKKKHIRESVHAKKMLLTYSSSSDTDDEQLRTVIKEIKDSLLKEISDDETKKLVSPEKDSKSENPANYSKSDSEAEDVIKKLKKKKEDSRKKEKHKREKHKRSKDGSNESDEDRSSSRRKMVRSKSKPGNCSSSQNSDARDSVEKEIDGLTNLNSLNKVRRRNSDDSDETQESKTSNKKEIKRSGLIDGEILQAESDSEVTDDENDAVEEIDEDLPPVTMSLNGEAMDHLVKEDLLGESDSSMSLNNDNEKNSETNKEDSEEDEKMNAKRRKANAISSDSEVGSSRKKDKDVRLSDFEDTEDENSEPGKKSKRKKKGSDSDASVGSTDGGKKKRRRIKSMDSDVSGSESETEGRNKHGRKNIRKVMGKNQLEEATKKAAREEKERIARITERQKLYNNLEFDESGKPDEVVLEKVVLDFDPETKEPLIEVDRGLVKKLKPHQANGIKFMWNACFESVKRIKKDKGSGCILAHCMGLGKTLQVVSLTHTLLTHGELTGVNRVLVVCPLSTVLNWVNEFRMWLKHAESDYDLDVYELSRFKQNSERAFQLSQWLAHGGVCVLGYEMFRNLSADNSKKFKKKMLKNFQEALVDPGPDLVVCDEGHLLKNEKTSLSQSMNRVKTLRRIVLTGTPLQNNLKEYYCMVQFVKPNLLGKYNEYLNRFVNPITNGQYTDSTEHDIKVMKRRSHVLHKMLDGAVQRRDYGVLAPFLPPKHEYVLFITLTEVQVKLYQYYLDNYSRRPLAGKSSGFLFPDFQSLQRIWTHPLVLKYNSERYEIMQQKKREREEEDSEGSLVDFIDDDSTPDETSSDESSDDLSDDSDDSRKKSKKKKSAKKSKAKESKGGPRRGTRANPIDQEVDDDQDDVIEVKNDNPTEWWIKMVTDDEIEDMRNSHKLVLLFDILRQCETIGDKLLVFSQSLYSLDLIEHFLGKVDEATQEGRIDEKLGGHVGSWSPGVDYFRLDGSTSCENRSIWCKNFNREDNPRARLFLISTRAGGLGINLVAANRVVIFDVSWNPSHDVQSIFRVYRFGQKKPCYVYRFLAMGTMEEKIYERQVTKQAISKRVIDEQQIDRHYAENDLAELYKFEPTPPSPRELPPLPKDRLFAEMLKEHEAQIYKYHEHDSLLENKEEETLSEEERKAAWEDFENEKNRPPPAPFPSTWPMHNGMVPNLLAQQQQQLAYAALSAMLRKDMPNINDNQIRDMIPLIYNSNPGMFGGYDYGLMQKMSEIYKYAPGMMNPMMAGNVMNSASGAGAMGGMGGTSGLQYEPPWQRQQQLRLQQIMQQQQQNQMGAKLYAGGLGSRDPVAMALQQARAREIMLGGGGGGAGAGGGAQGAGRPRGRPPMQPRAPPTAAEPGDVVNLDSD